MTEEIPRFEKVFFSLELIKTIAESGRIERDLTQISSINQAQIWYHSQKEHVAEYPFPKIVKWYTESELKLWSLLQSYTEGSTLSEEETSVIIKSSLKMGNLIRLLQQRLHDKNSIKQEIAMEPAFHFLTFVVILFFLFSLTFLFISKKKLTLLQQKIVTSLSPSSTIFHHETILDSAAKQMDLLQKELQRLEIIQKRLHRMFNALPLGVIAFERLGTILVANKLFMDTFCDGVSPVGEFFSTIMARSGFSGETRGKIAWKNRDWWIAEYEIDASFYLIFQDVTEQEKMAAKLLNSERLVSIGEMASRITHEIRNPLSTIKMNSEYMREHASEMTPEEIEKTFKPVINEIVRLEQITDKYINMVRYRSTNEIVSAVIPDDLAELVAFHRPEMEARNIQLEVTFPSYPLTLGMPADAFREVILNIMKNGWEEIGQDGSMHLRVVSHDDSRVEIHVEDSGEGISDEIKDKIFETFFTGKEGGTGIGLSHSKTLVKEHGGTITVAKSILGGADFSVSLSCESENKMC